MKSKTFANAFSRIAPFVGALPLSYSRASTLFRCPRQFDCIYRRKEIQSGVPPANNDTRVGSIAHQILECTVGKSNATGMKSPAGGCFNTNFSRLVATADNADQAAALSAVKEMMEKVLSEIYLRAEGGDYTMTVERELKFALDGTHIPTSTRGWRHTPYGRLGFRGYVDLELKDGDELLIYDYKTEMPSDERRESVEFQMALYAFCEFEARPHLKRIATNVAYLKNGEIDEIAVYKRDRDYESLRGRIEGWLNDYVKALERFDAKPVRNAYCKYCGFADGCCA